MTGSPDARSTPASETSGRPGGGADPVAYGVELVTWRRRPLFGSPAVQGRAEALLRASAEGMGCRVTRCEVALASAVVWVEAPPAVTPGGLVAELRDGVSGPLAAEVGAVADAVRQWGGVFVPQYLVTTGPDTARK